MDIPLPFYRPICAFSCTNASSSSTKPKKLGIFCKTDNVRFCRWRDLPISLRFFR
jgi:hypothetical protein